MLRMLSILILVLGSLGCASVGSVPSSIADAKLDDPKSGKVGWSRYQGSDSFPRINKKTAMDAARFALNQSEFVVQRDESDLGYVVGRHGMTMYDWDVICGVYILELADGCKVKVIAQGSYDFGFAGDATGSDWVQDVLRCMHQYLSKQASTGK